MTEASTVEAFHIVALVVSITTSVASVASVTPVHSVSSVHSVPFLGLLGAIPRDVSRLSTCIAGAVICFTPQIL
jgi:hypothetical protein